MEQSVDYVAISGMVTGIVISLGLFAAIFFAIFYAIKAKNKERMALIDKGVDISEIYRKKDRKNVFFKFGMILIGIAAGLVFGVIFSGIRLMPPAVAYFSMILLFGGGAILLANHLLEKKA